VNETWFPGPAKSKISRRSTALLQAFAVEEFRFSDEQVAHALRHDATLYA